MNQLQEESYVMEDKGNATIRDVKAADLEAVAAIYNEHIAGGISTMEQSFKTGQDIQAWLDGYSEREGLFVLEQNSEVIGFGLIKKYSPREGYRFAAETAVYLKGQMIGKGYGSFLKRFIIEKCREYGYHHLVAKIFSVNTASIEYNRRLGYEIVGEQKEVGFVKNEWMNVTIMQLLLS